MGMTKMTNSWTEDLIRKNITWKEVAIGADRLDRLNPPSGESPSPLTQNTALNFNKKIR